MIPFFIAVGNFFRAIWHGMADPEFKALVFFVLIVLGTGTIFYHKVEHWSLLDSFYFSVTTLTTVGYGDFHPTNNLSKIFTIIYIFIGLGAILSFVTSVSHYSQNGRKKKEQ